MSNGTYEVYETTDGFRWRLTARNGEVADAPHEAYSTRSNAARALRSLRPDAKIDVGGTPAGNVGITPPEADTIGITPEDERFSTHRPDADV